MLGIQDLMEFFRLIVFRRTHMRSLQRDKGLACKEVLSRQDRSMMALPTQGAGEVGKHPRFLLLV